MLNNIKISLRLLILLAMLLGGLVMVGGLGLYASSKTNDALESAFDEKLIPIMQLNSISRANQGNRIAIANAVIQSVNMPKYIEEITANKVVIDKQWEAFVTSLTDEEDQILAAKFAEARKHLAEEGVEPALAAMRANDTIGLMRLRLERLPALYTKIDESLDALMEMEKRDTEMLHEESAATFKTMRMLSIVLILTGAVVCSALGFSIIHGIHRSVDELRGVKIVEPTDLQRAVNQYVKYNSIIEGMLSHLLHSDAVIVLRCNPEELTKRLKGKGWKENKIRENVEAEMIDTITIESLQKHPKEKISEIDTSDKTPRAVAETIERVLKGQDREKHKAGSIDWTKEYIEYLVG